MENRIVKNRVGIFQGSYDQATRPIGGNTVITTEAETVTKGSRSFDPLSEPTGKQNDERRNLNPSWPRWLKLVWIENAEYGSELFWLLFNSVADSVEKGEPN